ncbi:MAG: endonuclease III [Deltaproteobacteria bacterium]|nr:endonuclease III [Deltaproteobacteria bacterium]
MASRPAAPPRRARKAAPINALYERLDRAHPDAKLALDFTSPLELLVALILAAQCTDAKVNEVTPGLFRRFPTARDFAAVSQEDLEEWVRPTGFYRQKAKAVRACCQQLVERFGGEVPRQLDDLLTLSGVGRKTANILRGNAFGLPGIGVDTHVGRLSQRLGLTTETEPDRIEADLTAMVPAERQIRFCHLLQYHGRRVCFARKPDCPACVLIDICPFPGKTTPPEPKKTPTRSRWVGKPKPATRPAKPNARGRKS